MAILELHTAENNAESNRSLLSCLLLTSVELSNALNETQKAIDSGSTVFHEAELWNLNTAILELKIVIDSATKKISTSKSVQ